MKEGVSGVGAGDGMSSVETRRVGVKLKEGDWLAWAGRRDPHCLRLEELPCCS